MVDRLGEMLAAWFSQEPTASLLVFVTAVLIFGVSITNLGRENPRGLGGLSRLTVSIMTALVFLGSVGVFYFLLTGSFKVFKLQAERLSLGDLYEENVKANAIKWGNPLLQDDLRVDQFRTYTIIREIKGPDDKILYKNVEVVEKVEQESTVGFNGEVNLHLTDREHRAFLADVAYEYEIANQSEYATTAEFRFPLGSFRMIQDLSIHINGTEIGPEKMIDHGSVFWTRELAPGEHVLVLISYTSSASETYLYRVSASESINDFSLVVHVDSADVNRVTQPETTAFELEKTKTQTGYDFSWKIDNAIVKPRIGIEFKPFILPDPAQKTAIQLIRYMPKGLMLYAVMLAFTLLIFGIEVDLRRFFLGMALFAANLLCYMGLDLLGLNDPFVLPLLGLMTLLVVHRLYTGITGAPFLLIMFLSALFILGYPYAGLFKSALTRNAFDSFSQAFVIVYIFILSLSVRIWRRNN